MGVVKKEGGVEGREVWHMCREVKMMALQQEGFLVGGHVEVRVKNRYNSNNNNNNNHKNKTFKSMTPYTDLLWAH